jgi:hypothetical protein
VYQYQGVSGTGRVSGLTYHLTGGSRLIEYTTEGLAPVMETHVSTGQFIVAGPSNNQVLGGRLHITINPNGVRTSYFESSAEGCR